MKWGEWRRRCDVELGCYGPSEDSIGQKKDHLLPDHIWPQVTETMESRTETSEMVYLYFPSIRPDLSLD